MDGEQDRIGSFRQLAQIVGNRRQHMVGWQLCQSRHDFAQCGARGRTDLRGGDRSGRLSGCQGWAQNGGGICYLSQLGLLILGHEAVDRQYFRNQRQAPQLLGQHGGCSRVRGQDVDGERVGQRRIFEVVQSLHRFGMRVLGMQRVGVKAELWQQDGAQAAEKAEPDQQRPTAAADEFVERCRPAETDFGSLAVRSKQPDRGRKKGHGAEKGDQHPHSGDQPQLGYTAEVSRDKGEKPRRGGSRRHQDLTADAPAGFCHCRGRGGVLVAVFAIAHAELDGEVDGNTNE